MKSQIAFIENVSCGLKNLESVKQWLIAVVENERKSIGVLTYVFMSDDDLLEYNKQYLSHDFYTDVITFDESEFPVINGDILISIDRIKDNSNALQTGVLEETLRVIVHGVLHLCGYKDKTEIEETEMRAKEEYYLKNTNLIS